MLKKIKDDIIGKECGDDEPDFQIYYLLSMMSFKISMAFYALGILVCFGNEYIPAMSWTDQYKEDNLLSLFIYIFSFCSFVHVASILYHAALFAEKVNFKKYNVFRYDMERYEKFKEDRINLSPYVILLFLFPVLHPEFFKDFALTHVYEVNGPPYYNSFAFVVFSGFLVAIMIHVSVRFFFEKSVEYIYTRLKISEKI